jgi:curli production assembly/transport component CsgG
MNRRFAITPSLRRSIFGALLVLSPVAACKNAPSLLQQPPVVTPESRTGASLAHLPPPNRKIDIAVYEFPDMTGKNEANDNIAQYSRAVTQGAVAFVIDSLRHTGDGSWFDVVERNGLKNLLEERQLIRTTRKEAEGDEAEPLPPIRFAGVILEGGIVGYDANTKTGGVGANYLGIGGNVDYRRDVVTVGMRIVSVQTGQVLISVTTTKTIYSVGVAANVNKFVAVDKLLQAEAGFTQNEPTQLAVREAIELAVYSLVVEGAEQGLWHFENRAFEKTVIARYNDRTANNETPTLVPTPTPKPGAGS